MKTALILLSKGISEDRIRKEYLSKLKLNEDEVLCRYLYETPNKKKTSAVDINTYWNEEIIPLLNSHSNIKYIVIANIDYFKVIAKVVKPKDKLGYLIPYGSRYLVFCPSIKAIFFNPDKIRHEISLALTAINEDILGDYVAPGTGIIKHSEYPSNIVSIRQALSKLHQYSKLTCDIETWSLKHYDAGLVSITFCWNQNEGIAFLIDKLPEKDLIRQALKEFFESYKGTLIFHNISFDAYVLTYQLYMNDLLDTEGLLKGLDILLRNFEDTKLIAYLATNTCAGNELGLKPLSQEYTGSYAQENISNIDVIPISDLLKYNLTDGLATWYVYNKYYPKMVLDKQLDIYEKLFKPAVKDIIQMQLTGMPMDMDKVKYAKSILQQDCDNALNTIYNSKIIKEFEHHMKETWVILKNQKLKKKQVTIDDCKESFNPGSGKQLRELLYTQLQLPIIATTETNLPSVSTDTFKGLINKTDNNEIKELLSAFVDYFEVIKILQTFIPAFEKAIPAKDGKAYLFGNFNLGGTASGRLSSSNVNLQQLPSTGTKYAKLIKECFVPPKGYLFVGLDFASLEAHIDALVTKDPAKLAVYIHGYDSHMYNTIHYWKNKFKDIYLFPEDSSDYGYEVVINNESHFLTKDTLVKDEDGNTLTIEEYYAINRQTL